MKNTKVIFLLAAIVFPLFAYGQHAMSATDSLNRKDKNGLKQGHFFEWKRLDEFIAGYYKDDLKEGVWTIYFAPAGPLPPRFNSAHKLPVPRDSIGYAIYVHDTIKEYRIRKLPWFHGDTALTAYTFKFKFYRDSVRLYFDFGKTHIHRVYIRHDSSLHFPVDLAWGAEGGANYVIRFMGEDFTGIERRYDKLTGRLVYYRSWRSKDDEIIEEHGSRHTDD